MRGRLVLGEFLGQGESVTGGDLIFQSEEIEVGLGEIVFRPEGDRLKPADSVEKVGFWERCFSAAQKSLDSGVAT